MSLDSGRGPASVSPVKDGRQERHWLGVQIWVSGLEGKAETERNVSREKRK